MARKFFDRNFFFWLLSVLVASVFFRLIIDYVVENPESSSIKIFSIFITTALYAIFSLFVFKNDSRIFLGQEKFFKVDDQRQIIVAQVSKIESLVVGILCLIKVENGQPIFEEKIFDKAPFRSDLKRATNPLKVGDIIVITITGGDRHYCFLYNEASKKQKFRFNFYNKNSRG